MIKNFFKASIASIVSIATIATITSIGLASCNPEPDESDLFTATGETAADFIKRKAELTSFDYILSRVRLDRNLSSYGEYTCFAPTNDAIKLYLDSLWNDPEAVIPHNGMENNSLEGLSDSLCNDIAMYHLAAGVHNTIEMGGAGGSVATMLGRPVQTSGAIDSLGRVTIEKLAVIIEPDSLVTNGIVHVLNRVIPRSTRLIADELDRHEDYSIFMEALKATGLVDSLTKTKKNEKYTITDRNDTDGSRLYTPEECLIAYTIFAEPDVVLAENGINSFDDLVRYANEQYASAEGWYDMLTEKGLWNNEKQEYVKTVSTGTDYTNRNNALNMFVSYHILYAGMPQNELVYEKNSNPSTWNYTNGCQPFDYYETMLPGTILKIWEPTGTQLYINRYRTFNTLTDELGSETAEVAGALVNDYGIHRLVREGVRIARTTDNLPYETNIQTYNGYIHGLRSMLVYDELVPKGVLHERMRFDSTTFLVEFINNHIRMSTMSLMSAKNGGGSGARVAFPLNYFDNVVSYSPENRFRYNVKGAYNAWQSDTFQGWGNYDLAIKLPHVPTGTYEFRIFYTPMAHGGMMQFYLGTSSSLSSMMALDIPLDVRIGIDDPRIGSTTYFEEDDMGVATDAAMRNRGYMRGLFSYRDHPEYSDWGPTVNQRSDKRNASLRKILSRQQFRQSQDYWFRIKNVIQDETDLKWQFDYIEFVPVDVVDNDTYSEDWY